MLPLTLTLVFDSLIAVLGVGKTREGRLLFIFEVPLIDNHIS